MAEWFVYADELYISHCTRPSRTNIFALRLFFVAIILMALVGLALGVLGSGGSMVALPVLVYVAGIPSHQAVGMSLVIVGGTSALGCLLSLRHGAIDLRASFVFTMSGLPGAFAGARFTHLISARVILMSFGALLLATGARLLITGDDPSQPSRRCQLLPCILSGFAVGILTGFLGVGGGIVVLPALVLFAGLEMRTAIGTALAVIAANCFAGLAGQLRYVSLDLPLTLAFLAFAAVGLLGGRAWAARVASTSLQRALAWSILVLGAFLLLGNAFRVRV